jgi:hypothetical protein
MVAFKLRRFSTALLLFLIGLYSLPVLSQQLTFCEKVDRNGNAQKPSNYFIIRPTGGTVQALVTYPRPLQLNEATIDIYQIGPQGKEQFESSVNLPVQQDWLWFVQPLRFYKKGNYVVYVYGDKSRLLGVSKIRIDVR